MRRRGSLWRCRPAVGIRAGCDPRAPSCAGATAILDCWRLPMGSFRRCRPATCIRAACEPIAPFRAGVRTTIGMATTSARPSPGWGVCGGVGRPLAFVRVAVRPDHRVLGLAVLCPRRAVPVGVGGRKPLMRIADRRDCGLLGSQQLWGDGAAGWGVLGGVSGRFPFVRATNRPHCRVLGRQ